MKWDCIDLKKNTITIREAKVIDENNNEIVKGTKSTAGKRTIKIYPFVANVFKKQADKTGYVTNLTGRAIYARFYRILKKINIKHYRLHDLRHYTVSVMLSLGIPKNYIANYMGHETEHMIDSVYGHIMSEKMSKVENEMQVYFSSLMQHEKQHENK